MEDRLWRYIYNAAKELKSDPKLKKIMVTVVKVAPVMFAWYTLMILIGFYLILADNVINVKYWIDDHIDDAIRELIIMSIGTAVAVGYVIYLVVTR